MVSSFLGSWLPSPSRLAPGPSWARLGRLAPLVMGSGQDCCVQVKPWGPEEGSWAVRGWVLLKTI